MSVIKRIYFIGWITLIIAVSLDLIVPFLLAPFYSGYNHNKMVMSLLGNPNSPVRVIYNIWLILLGFLLIFSAFLLFDSFKNISHSISILLLVILLLFAFGACISSGIFSVNESKSIETISSKIHGYGSVIGFMALLFAPLLLSRLSFKSSNRITGVLCFISFILAIIFFILFVMADKTEFQRTIIANEGLWQRLTLLFMYFPFAFISLIKLLKY